MILSVSLLLALISSSSPQANLDPKTQACIESCHASFDRPNHELKQCVVDCLKKN